MSKDLVGSKKPYVLTNELRPVTKTLSQVLSQAITRDQNSQICYVKMVKFVF